MHRQGRLHLVLILPDGSKSLIPVDWTDLASAGTTSASSLGTDGRNPRLPGRLASRACRRRRSPQPPRRPAKRERELPGCEGEPHCKKAI
jgi:hypothetical protein